MSNVASDDEDFHHSGVSKHDGLVGGSLVGERGRVESSVPNPLLVDVLLYDIHAVVSFASNRLPKNALGWLLAFKTLLFSFFPMLRWIPKYSLRYDLYRDILAGATHGIMVIPQGMAYAVIAGLHPVYGLYCAFVPPLVYFTLGSSPHLVVGPTAVLSLMTASAASNLYELHTDEYRSAVLMIAFWVGVLEFTLGVLRVGFLANLLSHSLISGFTSAAGVLIACSQLHTLLGISAKRHDVVYDILIELGKHIQHIHGWTTLMGLSACVLLYAMKSTKWTSWIPAPLVIVVVATLLSWVLRLDRQGVEIVGHVPAGLPVPSFEAFASSKAGELVPDIAIIALVAFIEAISVGRTFANRCKYSIDSNQELVALGMSNILGSFFRAYPATGSFSRTAVNVKAGGRSPLSNLVGSVLVMISLLFLTTLFHYLPKTILAAIIIVAVVGLVDVREPIFLLRCNKPDFIVLVVTFIGTLVLGIKWGIAVAVAVELFLVMLMSLRPKFHQVHVEDYLVPSHHHHHHHHDEWAANASKGILVVKFEENIFFMNADYMKETLISTYRQCIENISQEYSGALSEAEVLQSHLSTRHGDGGVAHHHHIKAVVMDCSSINDIDASGIHALVDVDSELSDEGVRLMLLGLKASLRRALWKSGKFPTLNRMTPATMSQVVQGIELHQDEETSGYHSIN